MFVNVNSFWTCGPESKIILLPDFVHPRKEVHRMISLLQTVQRIECCSLTCCYCNFSYFPWEACTILIKLDCMLHEFRLCKKFIILFCMDKELNRASGIFGCIGWIFSLNKFVIRHNIVLLTITEKTKSHSMSWGSTPTIVRPTPSELFSIIKQY